MAIIINTVFKLKRGSSKDWEQLNPVLEQGEPGLALDLNRMKVGNGVSSWNDLPYFDLGKSAYDLACENGFEGTVKDWLESLTGDTPQIGPNGNWIIGDIDTGITAVPDLSDYATKTYVEESMIALTTQEILDICNKK